MDTITSYLVSDAESARTSGRTSTRNSRVEVLTHPERRRSWTVEQKREIVAESLGPELTPAEVARKHGISTGQIHTWRHQLLSFRPTAAIEPPRFASVELTSAPGTSAPDATAALPRT